MALGSAGSRSGAFQLNCWLLILPTLALLALFLFVPMIWAIATSLYRYEVGGHSAWVGLGNYVEYARRDPTFLISLRNMLLLTIFAVAMRMTIPLIVAKLIISLESERWRHAYRIIFLTPIVVPAVAVQLIWQYLIYSEAGMVNETLELLGLATWGRGWLADPHTALWAVAFIGFPFVGGFEVLIYYAGLASIPESVTDSATLDGATGLRRFLSIDIPMVLSQLRLIVTLTIITGIQAFEGIYIITKGGPGFETLVPGLWMYFNAFKFQRMGYGCAIGVMLFVLIAGLTALNLRYFKSAEEVQA